MIKKLFFLLLFTVSVFGASGAFVVKELTCDYKVNPLGIDNLKPQLSWILFSTDKNVLQSAYEIRVSEGKRAVWKTGKVNSSQSVHIPYEGEVLLSGKKYSWQVRVWDDKGKVSEWSEVSTWEMGLLTASDWQAKWIEAKEVTDGKVSPAPMFKKGFTLAKPVKSARLYATAHGLYEAYLNGKRVGRDYFRPGWTSKKRLQYQTYDVTALLQKGVNIVETTVGDGWYRGNLEFNNKRNTYGKEVALLFQLVVTYADGSTEQIISDGTWSSSFNGPILASDIYNGETYDARKAFNNDVWVTVRVLDISKDNLVAEFGPTVTKHEEFKPVKMITTPKGEVVADFGQNLVGWVRIRVKGKAGDTVVLHHAEVLDKEGNFYTDNLRGAKQENRFILKGGDVETLEPHFTFQGFRYVKVSGVMPELTAVAIYSDMSPAGTFECSNPLINQLQHNIQWGQKGNFLDVPTDCPQRDERLGWTGDAQVFFNTAAYNMNVAGFFTKWLKDLKMDQHPTGNIPVVIPDVRSVKNAGSAGWGDVATIIPWNFYVAYGDKQLLQEQYPSMKAWVNYIRSISKDNLWNSGPHYGDWLFYIPNDDKDGKAAITDKFLIAQAFYANSTQNLINAARILGNEADVKEYTALLDTVKKAFMHEYVAPSGRLVSSSQTAYVLALNFDLLPEGLRASAAKRLADNIASYGNHLTTGFLGTPYLCHVLTRFGYNDVAYKLLLQDTYPSWLYPVKKGATTIWERWDGIKQDGSFQNVGMNSFNHYAYGAIGDWMYKVVAGINPDVTQVGYKHIVIAPKPGGGLTSASASYKTLYGEVKSAWRVTGDVVKLDITIPCNTTATIILPDGKKQDVGSGEYQYECSFAK
ncbi:Bacterial alpha-L-rhamnosidase [Chitinophaga sp. SYP-B3965]|uniref:glycoside hydrolase family 78 protein n=1 Tax=Chitinophaga sp. SYP-B3965 TaxID=2663120 RepID=UPI001299A4BE|nr:glycoside hydrolase family 78 protein [Chitinophaga sp. SYP-B3965]MRG48030.1 Bacterial alpha-L-rhamnosidase [Chitinophaga sp. SYP-B3965]